MTTPKKVLIADDQPDSRHLLEDILDIFKPYGVVTLIACDGDQAYDLAVRERPDLLLLDIMMPGMSGFEVCKKIKGDPELARIYIIMVSARSQPGDRVEAGLCGADEYVTKPFALDTMMERVEAVLGVTPI